MSRTLRAGDIAFTDLPNTSSAEFKSNAEDYLGPNHPVLIQDPLANPSLANRSLLQTINRTQVLIIIGSDELLLSENVIFGQHLRDAGVHASVHVFDQMWHVFPMYLFGCRNSTHDSGVRLLFAQRFFEIIGFLPNLIDGVFFHFERNGNDTLSDASFMSLNEY
jgi:acetyl esterase/lipase